MQAIFRIKTGIYFLLSDSVRHRLHFQKPGIPMRSKKGSRSSSDYLFCKYSHLFMYRIKTG